MKNFLSSHSKKILMGIHQLLPVNVREPIVQLILWVRQVVDENIPSLSESSKSQPWIGRVNAAQKLVVVLSGIPFAERSNQRPLNIAKLFASKGHIVLFVRWQWHIADFDHRDDEQVYPNVWQVSQSKFERVIRRKWLHSFDVEKLLYVSFPSESNADLAFKSRLQGFKIWYDIMDEWEAFSHLGQAPWYKDRIEEELCNSSDWLSAVSPALVKKFQHLRQDIDLVPNGYSPELLNPKAPIPGVENGKIADTRRMVGYVGHLTEAWFDWELVIEIAKQNPQIVFEIIGFGVSPNIRSQVVEIGNIRLVGSVDPGKLRFYAERWDYAILPFREGELARAVDPIKIYEYIHFNLRTFVTGVEAVKTYPGVFFSSRENASESFTSFLELGTRLTSQETLEFLSSATWNERLSKLVEKKRIDIGIWRLYA